MSIHVSFRNAAAAFVVAGVVLPAAGGGCGGSGSPGAWTATTSGRPGASAGPSNGTNGPSSSAASNATSSATSSATSRLSPSPDASSSASSHPGADAGQADSSTGAADGSAADAAADAGMAATRGIDPLVGCSSWSFIRKNPTEANIKAQAQALLDSGLAGHGFVYVNIDDFYYLNPNTDVDANGRWVVDTSKFPDGMAGMASFCTGSA